MFTGALRKMLKNVVPGQILNLECYLHMNEKRGTPATLHL